MSDRPQNLVTAIGLPPRSGGEGPTFWRSLDELTGNPEFSQWVEHEFPALAEQNSSNLSRRELIKLMGASFALAGLGGCRRTPPESIVPAVRGDAAAPNSSTFATALTRDGYALGVLVESHLGRPIKIEGNPLHPASLGATDTFAQAELLTFYDPGRSRTVYERHAISTWEAAQSALHARFRPGGRGWRLLTLATTSPTTLRLIEQFLRRNPEARWHVHAPINGTTQLMGTRDALGQEGEAVYCFSKADVVVSLDGDFLYGFPGAVRYARDFSDRRRIREIRRDGEINRLYMVENCPTVTGANADHRLPAPARQIADIAVELARALEHDGNLPALPQPRLSDAARHWVQTAARDLRAHRGRSLVLAGWSQPPHVHALATVMNQRLGNLGHTVDYISPVSTAEFHHDASTLGELTADMADGHVETLLILDSNPAYTAPADVPFTAALKQVPLSVHAGLYRDETAQLSHWHLPLTHELESWGDARAYDGTATIIQPLIQPLYQGKTLNELLAPWAGEEERTALALVEATWRRGHDDFDAWWNETLGTGVIAGTASRPLPYPSVSMPIPQQRANDDPPDDELELVIRPDPCVWDGVYANNAWLQELPRQITKLTWDNAVLMSQATARRLDLENEQVVILTHRARTVEGPVWIVPGHVDQSVTVFLGYGRWSAGDVGNGVGFNAYALRFADAPWQGDEVDIQPTARRHALACTQHHQLMENRDLVRAETWSAFSRSAAGAPTNKGVASASFFPALPEMTRRPQWGMSIDLTTCIGCGACTIACQAENNIPVVGKQDVIRGREMHWIRVDRYFAGPAEDPRLYHMPVPCMHCETAPCELVCPVNATTHSADGLNEMTYNRCVGTRYCSNNCPYKVRRFNFRQYSDHRPESLELMRNPQVTVRDRGVMEKCTYCVQRIRRADVLARIERRDIRDGEVVTACQQVCPTRAITFGDILDPHSAVTACKNQPHDYGLLADLNTRPRTTYLAAIRNPHVDLTPELVANARSIPGVQD